MKRRDLLKHSALAMVSFSMARNAFALSDEPPLTKETIDETIILRANENPHGPSPLARKAMMEAVNSSNRYQWDTNGLLREKIGALTGHTKEYITLGSGSSELLGLVCLRASYLQGHVIASEPTFKLWMGASRKMGLATRLFPLTKSKHNDLDTLLASINEQTKLLYLCNPNNPTGTAHGKEAMENFIKAACQRTTVLLDEAYTDYEDTPSMAHLINSTPNLIIAKTFSKVYGMAGARVGYLLAQPEQIKALNELQAWANAGPSAVSMKGALAAMEDESFANFCKVENREARRIFCEGLQSLGIEFIPSVTSFVYFNSAGYPKPVAAYLQSKQIIGARSFEENSSWLRISIGTQEEMKRVIAVLRQGIV
jgi:histidinol-phosphate aminotransferase